MKKAGNGPIKRMYPEGTSNGVPIAIMILWDIEMLGEIDGSVFTDLKDIH